MIFLGYFTSSILVLTQHILLFPSDLKHAKNFPSSTYPRPKGLKLREVNLSSSHSKGYYRLRTFFRSPIAIEKLFIS